MTLRTDANKTIYPHLLQWTVFMFVGQELILCLGRAGYVKQLTLCSCDEQILCGYLPSSAVMHWPVCLSYAWEEQSTWDNLPSSFVMKWTCVVILCLARAEYMRQLTLFFCDELIWCGHLVSGKRRVHANPIIVWISWFPISFDPVDQCKSEIVKSIQYTRQSISNEIQYNTDTGQAIEVTDGLVVRAGVSMTWTVLSWSGDHEFETPVRSNLGCVALLS